MGSKCYQIWNKNPLKIAKYFENMPKWRNFAKCGHTGSDLHQSSKPKRVRPKWCLCRPSIMPISGGLLLANPMQDSFFKSPHMDIVQFFLCYSLVWLWLHHLRVMDELVQITSRRHLLNIEFRILTGETNWQPMAWGLVAMGGDSCSGVCELDMDNLLHYFAVKITKCVF